MEFSQLEVLTAIAKTAENAGVPNVIVVSDPKEAERMDLSNNGLSPAVWHNTLAVPRAELKVIQHVQRRAFEESGRKITVEEASQIFEKPHAILQEVKEIIEETKDEKDDESDEETYSYDDLNEEHWGNFMAGFKEWLRTLEKKLSTLFESGDYKLCAELQAEINLLRSQQQSQPDHLNISKITIKFVSLGGIFFDVVRVCTPIKLLRLVVAKRKKLRPECLKFFINKRELTDDKCLCEFNLQNGDVINVSVREHGGGKQSDAQYFLPDVKIPKMLGRVFVVSISDFDAHWNYDFRKLTHAEDMKQGHKRGTESYKRPCGSQRFAINVKKFGDNQKWLASDGSKSTWPVAFHGTSPQSMDSIVKNSLNAGGRQAYKHVAVGAYTTPDPEIAHRYAQSHAVKVGNKSVRVVFQCRVNPDAINKANSDRYWIIEKPKDVRPYGVCIYAD